jgi:2-polyprenyl-3-methyl-5-hydroxy-6-metoxy-1,4-benzoquinol methylase
LASGEGEAGLSRSDDIYYEKTRRLLERAYLGADDPRGASGFRGDEVRWERARRPILSAIDHNGPLLDIGCANGLLMESLVAWAAEDGRKVEPYGLDLIPSIADLARGRLPHWADRIFTGNVVDWAPPFRFDFVRTELEYVPRRNRQDMVERLLNEYLVPQGRLIVCSYGNSRQPESKAELVAEMLRNWGHEVAGQAEGQDINGVVITRVAWTDRPRN